MGDEGLEQARKIAEKAASEPTGAAECAASRAQTGKLSARKVVAPHLQEIRPMRVCPESAADPVPALAAVLASLSDADRLRLIALLAQAGTGGSGHGASPVEGRLKGKRAVK